jgi:ribonuclease HI
VQLFTTSDYVYQGATKWIHGWRRRDWQKRNGKPVANEDLWRELDRLLADYDVHWVNAKGEMVSEERGLQEAALLARDAIEMV